MIVVVVRIVVTTVVVVIVVVVGGGSFALHGLADWRDGGSDTTWGAK